ncbi:MAG: Gfo/Idh/MocA family protein [Lachnospirales bacterium]
MKLGIIGYGGMGAWHHDNIKEKIKSIEVVAVSDIRLELEEKAKENGVKFYKTSAELWNDKDIDIVTIATPNDFHKELAINCLRNGKHVVCEKPVTMNSRELEDVIAVAKEENKLFSVHQNRRWDKDYLIVKEILKNKEIGEPYYIESRVQGSRRAMHGWRGYKVNGGGMVYDWGVHLFDQILNLTESPLVSIHGHLFSIFSEEVDDNFKALLRFENGLSVLVEVATNCFINQPRWHICCKEGTFTVEDWDCNGKIVKLKENSEMKWDNDIVYTSAGPTRTMAPRPDYTTIIEDLPELESDWSDYYKNILESIKDRGKLIVKPEECLRVMKAIDTIFLSWEKGTAIKCYI